MTYQEELQARYRAVKARLNPQKPAINRAAQFRVPQDVQKIRASKPLKEGEFPELILIKTQRYIIQTCGITTHRLIVQDGRITFDMIARFVVDYTGLRRGIIFSPRRTDSCVQARHAIWILARQHLSLSYPRIGDLSGGFDHTTIMHACETFHPRKGCAPIIAAFNALHADK